jgi:hypothetical protein
VQSRKDYFPLKSSKFKLNLRANAQELTHQCGKNRSANVSGIDPPMFQEYSAHSTAKCNKKSFVG